MAQCPYPLRFPGEGRGPVAKVEVTTHNARQLLFSDWPPASAGEAPTGNSCLAKTTHRPHIDPVMIARPAPLKRYGQLALGILLMIVAPITAPLPGPAGTFLFAGGMILVLRNSVWARQRWARLKRRFPRIGGFVDRMMRRGSALRRHARDKAAAAN